jgi:hypothetical protein
LFEDLDFGECLFREEVSVDIIGICSCFLQVILTYFAAVNPDGPAPMIATESTLSRVLLGMEPMFLVEIYPLRCTESPLLDRRDSLLYARDIEMIDD